MQNTFQVNLRYSQNFIKSPELVKKLISLTDINKDDTVIEIGTGNGIIAKELAGKVYDVITIEKDKNLYSQNKSTLNAFRNVEVVNEDFLEYSLPKSDNYKVFSNVPFSITSEILNKLFFRPNPPLKSYLILQKEVGFKLVGMPYGNESQTSILLKPFFDIKILHTFNSSDFSPMPSVDVVFVEISKKTNPLLWQSDMELYWEFVIYSFNQWKPNIRMSLRKLFSNLQMKIIGSNLGFTINSKPSELNSDQWIGLFKEFVTLVPPFKRKYVFGSKELLEQNKLKMRQNNLENNNRRPTTTFYKKNNVANYRRKMEDLRKPR